MGEPLLFCEKDVREAGKALIIEQMAVLDKVSGVLAGDHRRDVTPRTSSRNRNFVKGFAIRAPG